MDTSRTDLQRGPLIVAATPVAGHTVPLLRLAGALRATGHDVAFVGGRRFLPGAAELGLATVALTGHADYDDRRMATEFPDGAALPPGLERLNLETAQIFGDAIPDQHETLQALLRENPDRLLITDILFAGAFPAACGVGIRPRRWISVGIAPVYVRSVDASPFGPVPAGPDGDAAPANLAAFDAFSGALQPAFEHIRGIVGSLGGQLPTSDWVSTLYALPDVTAQLSVPQFEFPRTDLPDSIRFVGLIPPTSASWDPPAWWPELASDLASASESGIPVVLVTQGTLANQDLGELIMPTLHALADRDVLVVAALGRAADGLPGPIPANARVVDYVPFDRVLPHVDVFVTNGGYGATQQALAAGVPVVVAGTTEDKPATAARVAFHRVGLDLQAQRPTPGAVGDAVRTLLADSGYRERVGRLARAYADYDAASLVARLAVAA